MTFTEYSKKHQTKIQREKEQVFATWKKRIDKETPDLNNLSKLLLESNAGGKNIRGTLVCLGYELFSTIRSKDIYIIAAAYEILHTSLLIHDDVIDKSLFRRGRKTIFQELGGDHYGISQAICLGDVGFFLATQMIHETTIDNDIKSTLVSRFSQIILDTISGQMLDIKVSNTEKDVIEKDVIKIAQLKTGKYTIAGPLLLGAILAGADKKHLDYISVFGEYLGIAFQIKDDLLGVFGYAKKLGKSNISDIEEGKKTLLFIYAYSHSSKKQKEVLDRYYGKGKTAPKVYEKIRNIMKETGADTYSEQKILEYTTLASQIISKFFNRTSLKFLLKDFINYLINRET